ncbi:ZNF76 [Cordylochernes scorpioides]|uniref:Protein hunchback n=1 Tax=Cordylochernes scorpioides TaxID=51811 RepID=A0ABY6KAH5_9ARAC|nr:ZNF76 [Cordylochernes scorpioides]
MKIQYNLDERTLTLKDTSQERVNAGYITKPVQYNTSIKIRMDNKGLEKARKQMLTCQYCDQQVKFKSHLIDHEKTHTGEREFMCDWKGCNFRSNRKFNVAQHKITHTEEKPFTCDHCPYRSAHKTHLRVHVRKHNDSKPYICDICEFKTSYEPVEVPLHPSPGGHKTVLYSCSLCGKKSKSKTYFTKHMKNKHQLQNINIKTLSLQLPSLLTCEKAFVFD